MISSMDDPTLGRLIRMLRHHRNWRMDDLASRAGVGLSTVERLEAGRIKKMQLTSIRAVVGAFGLSVDLGVRGLSASSDRLLDERHAQLQGACVAWLATLGWLTQIEVSYSLYGERGSIDILTWHSSTSTLLVIEIKSELVSVEATLRKLDEKVRLAPRIGRQVGWQPKVVGRLLVLPDESTQHRRVQAHAPVLDRALPSRTRQVRAWCRKPSGSLAGLLFLGHTKRRGGASGGGSRVRVAAARRPLAARADQSRPESTPANST
jgi:transcriptional regulator with XRE-family HTH domain